MRLFFLHIQPEHGKKALETKSDDSVDSQACERAGIISTFLKNSKYSKISPYSLGAILLIIAAVLLRVVLISNGWPKIDSDEATMGLGALHILTRGERPILFYGQNYNGTIEAYLGACFFAIFGPSSFALRLGLVVLYVGSLLALYLLACLLYTRGIALATVFLLCLGSNYTFTLELSAYGEYPDTLLFGALSLLLACWLALSFHPEMDSRGQRKRLAAYACLGGVIGLGLWSDLLILPFVYASLLLLIIFCHRELRTQASLFGLLGFLIGAFPLLIFNIEHPSHNSLSTLLALYRSGATSKRARGSLARTRGKNVTMITDLSLHGLGEAFLTDGAANGDRFQAYVEHILVPTLKPGEIVIMDNSSIHKGKKVQELIEAQGCELLFLPTYSPDVSPIEEAFSKITMVLRGIGARTREALQDALTYAITTVTASDASGWFRHCGYSVPASPNQEAA